MNRSEMPLGEWLRTYRETYPPKPEKDILLAWIIVALYLVRLWNDNIQ